MQLVQRGGRHAADEGLHLLPLGRAPRELGHGPQDVGQLLQGIIVAVLESS